MIDGLCYLGSWKVKINIILSFGQRIPLPDIGWKYDNQSNKFWDVTFSTFTRRKRFLLNEQGCNNCLSHHTTILKSSHTSFVFCSLYNFKDFISHLLMWVFSRLIKGYAQNIIQLCPVSTYYLSKTFYIYPGLDVFTSVKYRNNENNNNCIYKSPVFDFANLAITPHTESQDLPTSFSTGLSLLFLESKSFGLDLLEGGSSLLSPSLSL